MMKRKLQSHLRLDARVCSPTLNFWSTAIFNCSPVFFINWSILPPQAFIPRPLHTSPSTSIRLQFETQSRSPFLSTCPNHLKTLLSMISSIPTILKRLNRSPLCCLIFKRNIAHSSNHASLGSHHLLLVLSFHCPCFAPMHKHFAQLCIIKIPFHL